MGQIQPTSRFQKKSDLNVFDLDLFAYLLYILVQNVNLILIHFFLRVWRQLRIGYVTYICVDLGPIGTKLSCILGPPFILFRDHYNVLPLSRSYVIKVGLDPNQQVLVLPLIPTAL